MSATLGVIGAGAWAIAAHLPASGGWERIG
jgi:hypothetical protein